MPWPLLLFGLYSCGLKSKLLFFCFLRCWILSSLFCQTVVMFSLFQRMCIVILVILRYSFFSCQTYSMYTLGEHQRDNNFFLWKINDGCIKRFQRSMCLYASGIALPGCFSYCIHKNQVFNCICEITCSRYVVYKLLAALFYRTWDSLRSCLARLLFGIQIGG